MRTAGASGEPIASPLTCLLYEEAFGQGNRYTRERIRQTAQQYVGYIMETPRELTGQGDQAEPYFSLEDRSPQDSEDIASTWQYSHKELWELYQALRTHHTLVQTCYEALATAMGNGQETKTLWEEYHEAVTRHRLLTNRLRLALQQRLKGLSNTQEQHKPS